MDGDTMRVFMSFIKTSTSSWVSISLACRINSSPETCFFFQESSLPLASGRALDFAKPFAGPASKGMEPWAGLSACRGDVFSAAGRSECRSAVELRLICIVYSISFCLSVAENALRAALKDVNVINQSSESWQICQSKEIFSVMVKIRSNAVDPAYIAAFKWIKVLA
jgi:hypothetical protein